MNLTSPSLDLILIMEIYLYDIAINESFQNKLESFQYNAVFAITGAIRGSSRENLYQELSLKSCRNHGDDTKNCASFPNKKK